MVGSNNVEKQCQALALDVVGDRWGFLIIEDALRRGVSSFADFQRALDVPPAILAARIDGFLASGLMTLSRHPQHLDQYQYELTPKGLDLEPAVTALSTWVSGGRAYCRRRSSLTMTPSSSHPRTSTIRWSSKSLSSAPSLSASAGTN